MQERLIKFAWGFGGFVIVAVAAYLVNIADIREIDLYKVGTIAVISAAGYIVNQGSKYINTGK